MKFIHLLVSLFIISFHSYGQTDANAKETIVKLLEQSFVETQKDTEKSLKLAQEAYDLAEEENLDTYKASALHKMSIVYRFQGLYDKALQYGDSALKFVETLDEYSLKASILSNQGVSYRYKGDYESALNFFQKSITLHRKMGELEEEGTVLNSIGVLHMYLENYDKALDYYSKALTIQLESGNKKEEANIYNNFAIVYANQGILDSALTYFQYSYDIEKELGNKKGMSESINNIGAVHYYLGDFDNAIIQFEKSAAIDSSLGDVRGQIASMNNIAELYNESGQVKKAIAILEKSLQRAMTIDSKADIEVAHLNLSESFARLEQYEQALDAYQNYSTYHDSVLGQQKVSAIAEMETKFQTKEKEQQIKIQDLELADQTLRINARNKTIAGLSVVTFLIILISIFGYSTYKAKKATEMEKTLRMAEEQRLEAIIDATETERKRIARELHDGIGQQLSSIKLGLSALDKNTTSDEKLNALKTIVDDSADDVRNLSHQMMPKSLIELGLSPAVEDMLSKTLAMSKFAYEFDGSQLKTKLPEIVEINVYRIIQEITNNILKHSQGDQVDIQLYKSNNKLHLIYAENGTGFDINNSNSGLGLLNLETRIRRINGSIRFENQDDNFVATIAVPIS